MHFFSKEPADQLYFKNLLDFIRSGTINTRETSEMSDDFVCMCVFRSVNLEYDSLLFGLRRLNETIFQ